MSCLNHKRNYDTGRRGAASLYLRLWLQLLLTENFYQITAHNPQIRCQEVAFELHAFAFLVSSIDSCDEACVDPFQILARYIKKGFGGYTERPRLGPNIMRKKDWHDECMLVGRLCLHFGSTELLTETMLVNPLCRLQYNHLCSNPDFASSSAAGAVAAEAARTLVGGIAQTCRCKRILKFNFVYLPLPIDSDPAACTADAICRRLQGKLNPLNWVCHSSVQIRPRPCNEWEDEHWCPCNSSKRVSRQGPCVNNLDMPFSLVSSIADLRLTLSPSLNLEKYAAAYTSFLQGSTRISRNFVQLSQTNALRSQSSAVELSTVMTDPRISSVSSMQHRSVMDIVYAEATPIDLNLDAYLNSHVVTELLVSFERDFPELAFSEDHSDGRGGGSSFYVPQNARRSSSEGALDLPDIDFSQIP